MRDLPQDFQERVFGHILHLTGLGTRVTGTENEGKAIDYVRQQFEQLEVPVEVEPFGFESYEITGMDLLLGGKRCIPTLIGFNPYDGISAFRGNATLLDPQDPMEDTASPDLRDGVVVTAAPTDYFRLILERPRLIIYVDAADYPQIRSQTDRHFTLNIEGRLVKRRSANVIGQLRPLVPASANIILSAHLDAYGDSPGAVDNASGVGVLIELARYFRDYVYQITCPLKFIAFGAEEVALLGSRVYVDNHPEDLKRCALVLNLDQVGGDSQPYIEMLGGVEGMPEEQGQSQFAEYFKNRAGDGQLNPWKMNSPELMPPILASNHPEWLREIIEESAWELGIEVTPVGNTGGDQQSFTQAGVVATGIGMGGSRVHTSGDTADQVHPGNLENAGRIAVALVLKTMHRSTSG